jgi:sulfate transport system ATP-binding protein
MSISVRGVTKRFGAFTALDNVDLEVEPGKLVALLGPSGSGKTTLLRCIAGLEFADAGEIRFDGTDMANRKTGERRVGFVFQHYALFRHMTVFDNIAFGLRVRPRSTRPSESEIRRKIGDLLDLIQLQTLASRYPSQLSGGQRQRVALARALAVEPRVLLLDEPFGALDAQVRKELRAWLRRLHDEVHITTVLVTHDQEEAMEVADRLAVINLGRLEQVGSPSELYEQPANDFVLTFVGQVTRLGGIYVRPHDVEVHRDASRPGAHAATVDRVTSLGFEVRIELSLEDGTRTWVQIDRATAKAIDVQVGEHVYLSPDPEASAATERWQAASR